MLLSWRLSLTITLILCSCLRSPRNTAVGHWSGVSISIIKEAESVAFPINKYGYLDLSVNLDSTYTLALGVLKDVRVERTIFGIQASKLLIPAVYKTTRFGKWRSENSTFIFFNPKERIIAKLTNDGEQLNLEFRDEANRFWRCILRPKE